MLRVCAIACALGLVGLWVVAGLRAVASDPLALGWHPGQHVITTRGVWGGPDQSCTMSSRGYTVRRSGDLCFADATGDSDTLSSEHHVDAKAVRCITPLGR